MRHGRRNAVLGDRNVFGAAVVGSDGIRDRERLFDRADGEDELVHRFGIEGDGKGEHAAFIGERADLAARTGAVIRGHVQIPVVGVEVILRPVEHDIREVISFADGHGVTDLQGFLVQAVIVQRSDALHHAARRRFAQHIGDRHVDIDDRRGILLVARIEVLGRLCRLVARALFVLCDGQRGIDIRDLVSRDIIQEIRARIVRGRAVRKREEGIPFGVVFRRRQVDARRAAERADGDLGRIGDRRDLQIDVARRRGLLPVRRLEGAVALDVDGARDLDMRIPVRIDAAAVARGSVADAREVGADRRIPLQGEHGIIGDTRSVHIHAAAVAVSAVGFDLPARNGERGRTRGSIDIRAAALAFRYFGARIVVSRRRVGSERDVGQRGRRRTHRVASARNIQAAAAGGAVAGDRSARHRKGLGLTDRRAVPAQQVHAAAVALDARRLCRTHRTRRIVDDVRVGKSQCGIRRIDAAAVLARRVIGDGAAVQRRGQIGKIHAAAITARHRRGRVQITRRRIAGDGHVGQFDGQFAVVAARGVDAAAVARCRIAGDRAARHLESILRIFRAHVRIDGHGHARAAHAVALPRADVESAQHAGAVVIHRNVGQFGIADDVYAAACDADVARDRAARHGQRAFLRVIDFARLRCAAADVHARVRPARKRDRRCAVVIARDGVVDDRTIFHRERSARDDDRNGLCLHRAAADVHARRRVRCRVVGDGDAARGHLCALQRHVDAARRVCIGCGGKIQACARTADARLRLRRAQHARRVGRNGAARHGRLHVIPQIQARITAARRVLQYVDVGQFQRHAYIEAGNIQAAAAPRRGVARNGDVFQFEHAARFGRCGLRNIQTDRARRGIVRNSHVFERVLRILTAGDLDARRAARGGVAAERAVFDGERRGFADREHRRPTRKFAARIIILQGAVGGISHVFDRDAAARNADARAVVRLVFGDDDAAEVDLVLILRRTDGEQRTCALPGFAFAAEPAAAVAADVAARHGEGRRRTS